MSGMRFGTGIPARKVPAATGGQCFCELLLGFASRETDPEENIKNNTQRSMEYYIHLTIPDQWWNTEPDEVLTSIALWCVMCCL